LPALGKKTDGYDDGIDSDS